MPQKHLKSMPRKLTFQASLVECGDTITTGRLSQLFPFRTKTSDTAKNTNAVKLTRSLAMIKLSLLRVNKIMMVQRPHIYMCFSSGNNHYNTSTNTIGNVPAHL